MEGSAQRGEMWLSAVFVPMAFVFSLERIVYHVVVGFAGIGTSLVTVGILVGLGVLVYRGHGWLRWLIVGWIPNAHIQLPAGSICERSIGVGPGVIDNADIVGAAWFGELK